MGLENQRLDDVEDQKLNESAVVSRDPINFLAEVVELLQVVFLLLLINILEKQLQPLQEEAVMDVVAGDCWLDEAAETFRGDNVFQDQLELILHPVLA